jgi:hypothetical protein
MSNEVLPPFMFSLIVLIHGHAINREIKFNFPYEKKQGNRKIGLWKGERTLRSMMKMNFIRNEGSIFGQLHARHE